MSKTTATLVSPAKQNAHAKGRRGSPFSTAIPPSRKLVDACDEAETWTRPELLALAVAKGCRHYAPQWPELPPVKGILPNEVLGCCLLRGPADVETFRAIRCAAMVLSDLHNRADEIGWAARRFRVAGRAMHIARLGLTADTYPAYWLRVIDALSPFEPDEPEFMPGVSRLVSETRWTATGLGASWQWLRLGDE